MQISGIQSGSARLVTSPSKARVAAAFDPRDSNQDGVVSAAEDQAYALSHPGLELAKRLREGRAAQAPSRVNDAYPGQYTQQGTLNAAYYDLRDTNQNGRVSVAEAHAYALKHPQPQILPTTLKPGDNHPSGYNPQGTLNAGWKIGSDSSLDVYG